MHKLEYYGVRGPLLQLMTSYLSDRKFFIRYDNISSEEFHINLGVPQGSALGPTLFIIYVNDLLNYFSDLDIYSYADDTSIFFTGSDPDSIIPLINFELNLITEWFNCNRLKLNTNKSVSVLFHRSRKFLEPLNAIKISEDYIGWAYQVKFLGIIFSNDLRWNNHIDLLCKNLTGSFSSLRRWKGLLPSRIVFTYYYAKFFSILNYGILVYGNTSKNNIVRLLRLQKRFFRSLAPGLYDHHGWERFWRNYKIFPIDLLFTFRLATLMFRCVHKEYLSDIIVLKPFSTRYTTRSLFQFYPPIARTDIGMSRIGHLAINYWNNLDPNIRNIPTLSHFITTLRNSIFFDN